MTDPLSRVRVPRKILRRNGWVWLEIKIEVNTQRSRGGQKEELHETRAALRDWLRSNMQGHGKLTPAGVEFFIEDDALLFYMKFKNNGRLAQR